MLDFTLEDADRVDSKANQTQVGATPFTLQGADAVDAARVPGGLGLPVREEAASVEPAEAATLSPWAGAPRVPDRSTGDLSGTEVSGDKGITLGDYTKSLGIGLDQFGQVLGRGLRWVGAEKAGKAIEDLYAQREQQTRAEQSSAYLAEMQKPFLQKSEDGGGLFGYDGFGPGMTSPTKILGSIVESVPAMVAAGGPEVAMTKGLIGLGVRPGVAGLIGGGFGEGAIGGLYAAKEGEDALLEAPDDVMRQTPDYQRAYAALPADMPEAERAQAAKASVARSEALRSGLLVGGATALLGAPSGHFMGRTIGGETGKTLLGTVGKQALLEATQEASQNAVEKIIHNQAAQKYINPDQSLMEGVGEEAVSGAVVGGAMGAGMGGVTHNSKALRFRKEFQSAVADSVKTGEIQKLSDADLERTYAIAEGLYQQESEENLHDALLELNFEMRRRRRSPGESVEPPVSNGPIPEAQAEPGQSPEQVRTLQLNGMGTKALQDFAGSLGIDKPGRIKREKLIPRIMEAEAAARAWNTPEAVEQRYQEEHAAPFETKQDSFLEQAAPAPEAAHPVAPEAGQEQEPTPEQARWDELAAKSHAERYDVAKSLGIEKPKQFGKYRLITEILEAESEKRAQNEPEAVERRYQEEHATPFATGRENFLDQAKPGQPAVALSETTGPAPLPTRVIPLVEQGEQMAATRVRMAELDGMSHSDRRDVAKSLGIERPGRFKRDDLIAEIMKAEAANRAWNEPEAVEARYQEEHAAPFETNQDTFLNQARPGEAGAAQPAQPGPAPLPTGEIPLVEQDETPASTEAAAPASQSASRPSLTEEAPQGVLPTGEIPLVETGKTTAAQKEESTAPVNVIAETAPKAAPVLNEPPVSLNVSADLTEKTKTALNTIATSLGIEKPGTIKREDLARQIGETQQQQAAREQQAVISDNGPINQVNTINVSGVLPEMAPVNPGQSGEVSTGSPGVALAGIVKSRLESGEGFTSKQLFDYATQTYGGRMADGAFSAKDAYDAMELGVNQYIADKGYSGHEADAKAVLSALSSDILAKLPTQTRRSADQVELQQFSTPPHIAYAVARLADIQPGETVLEPSGGLGGLAVFAKNAGGRVILNEIDSHRRDMAGALGFDAYFGENAEQLHNILPEGVQPSVVVMNPPFSSSSGRITGKRDSNFVKPHLEQALKRLAPGGRLVAVVGDSMAPGRTAFQEWWKSIEKAYDVKANVGIDGREYRKYGTNYDVRLLVIDKTGPTAAPVVTTNYKTVGEALEGLESVRVSREQPTDISADQPASDQPARPGPAAQSGRISQRPGGAGPAGLDALGPGEGRPGGAEGRGRTGIPGQRGGADLPEGRAAERDAATPGTPGSGVPGAGFPGGERSAGSGMDRSGSSGQSALPPERPGVRPTDELTVQVGQEARTQKLTDSVFDQYQPAVTIQGAKPHPGILAESAAMASVRPATVSYVPRLPAETVTSGQLSAAQLEPVIYAGHAHGQILPSGEIRGYFIGDGTGVGKGREIAGILLDNWNQGRTKAVWISEKRELVNDAKRDIAGIGWDPNVVVDLAKTKAGQPLDMPQGIAFASYDTLRSAGGGGAGKSRLDQLMDWLGPDFDGVLAFDEAHNMGNAVEVKGKRGKTKPSKKALAGVELQSRLPKARVVYVSATGATEVKNLSYAPRLGLWGPETPFANVQAFMREMEAGGMSAMELVAANMKAMGLYDARSLSYDGVRYERLEHKLTPEQRAMYDKLAEAWQVVLRNINEALDLTGAAGDRDAAGAAMSQFWGSHQRSFNQVLTSMMTPTVLREMEADLGAGRSIVVQLTNTNEAANERQLAKMEKEGTELEDLDVTPREALMSFVEHSFPVRQYETVTDQNGNVVRQQVRDANGDPVFNREAVAKREELLRELGSVSFPEAPLDQIISHFGPDNVAEVTGRGRRVIWKDTPEGRRRVLEKRSKAMGQSEKEEFQNGGRRVLVFSEAGGTGQSYHADLDAQNQQQRVQYLLQAGWRADRAVQGLGRTHRSNQAQPPIYKLCTTDVVAQKRFLSTIARRLDQLGALTKGQRETGSQGIFAAKDNLENEYAKQAVQSFVEDLLRQEIPGLSSSRFEAETGLKLTREQDGMPVLNAPEVPQFLNRLLSLKLDMMDKVFDAFSERLDAIVNAAAGNGTLDTGINTIRNAKRISVGKEEVVHTDPSSGAQAKYVRLDVERPVKIRGFEAVDKLADGYVRNIRSGQVWALDKRNRERTLEGGRVEKYRTLYSPVGMRNVGLEELQGKGFETLSRDDAAKAWNEAVAVIPKTQTEPVHLLTGALLPIWDRIPDNRPRIIRALTEDGHKILGREIPSGLVNQTLENLGLGAEPEKATPSKAVDRILDGATARLANGWRIKRSVVSGEERLELLGPDYSNRSELQRHGLIEDIIAHRTRWFLPMDRAAETLEAVTRSRPVVGFEGGQDAASLRFAQSDAANAGQPLFRRGSAPATPQASEVVVAFQQGLAKFPALRGVVDLYHSEADMPEKLRRKIAKMGVSGNFYGAYDPETGRISFVGANIPSQRAGQIAFVNGLLRHEGRHGGLDLILGGLEARQDYMTKAARIMPREVARWLERRGLDSTRETRARAAEEVLVSWSKTGGVHRTLDKLLARIAEWVRTIFPNLSMTKAELRALLAQADDFVDGRLDFVSPLDRPLMAAPVFAQNETPDSQGYTVEDATMPREAATFREAREAVLTFVDKELKNDASGMAATVSRTNIGKMLSRKAVDKSVSPAAHALAVANLDRLFKIAGEPLSHPDRNADPNFKAIHRFYAPMIFDGDVLVAKMTVKEYVDPREKTKVYSVESMEIEKAAREWEAAFSPDQERKTSPQAAFSEKAARNWEASISPGQERIPSPQAAFVEKIRRLQEQVKGESGDLRLAQAGDLAGVPEEPSRLRDWVKNETMAVTRSILPAVRDKLKETGTLGKILRSPEYWRHPVLKRLYEIFRDRSDAAHELLHEALDVGGDKTILNQAKAALKDQKQRAILNEGVDYADVNEIQPEQMETWFKDRGATDATLQLWRDMRAKYDLLLDKRLESYRKLIDQARQGYQKKIQSRLVKAGVDEAAARTFDAAAYNADRTLAPELAGQVETVRRVVAEARQAGITIKGQLADVRYVGDDGKPVTISLKEAVERMGQLRGFYAPRLREDGDYVVRGERTREDGTVERFRAHKEWRAGAEKLRATMTRDGWTMEPVSRVEKLPEATQGLIKAIELAKTVESAARKTAGDGVDAAMVGQLVEQLAEDIKARGFRAQSIRRTGRHGEVVKGYLTDPMERFTRYAGNTAYGLAKMDAAGKAVQALFGTEETPGVDMRKEPEVHRLAVDYLAENLRNAEAGDRVFFLAKSIASLKYLGLNPRSAIVNLSSMATSVPAALHAYAMEGKGGWARVGREIARSMYDYLGVMTGKWGRFTAEEKSFLDAIRKESLDDPQFAREALSTYRDTAGKAWSWLMGKSLYLFGATEQLNRGSTLLAGYRLARAMGADHDTAMARARETSDRAHGVYSRATQPAWTWGTSAGARVGQGWYVYKKYGHNYLQLLHALFFNKKDYGGGLFALVSPMVLAGLGSQVLTSLVKGIFAAAGSDDDPEKWVYDKIRANLGGEAEDLARFGLLGLLTGSDLHGSIGTMIDIPDTWTDVLGPIGGLGRDILQGIGYFAGGQPGRGLEKLLPTGAAKVVQALREQEQGVTTSKNFPVIGEDGKPLRPTVGETVAKAAGFRPLSEARARAKTAEAITEEKRHGEERDRLYARFRAFVLDGATDESERRNIVAAVNDYNRKVAEAGMSGRVSYITAQSLLKQSERLAEPTRREKARIDGGRQKAIEEVTGEDIEQLGHPFYAIRRRYEEARQQYDDLREAGDFEAARQLRSESQLPRLRLVVGRVQAVHALMSQVRKAHLPETEKRNRLEILRDRERREMDRAAGLATRLRVASGE